MKKQYRITQNRVSKLFRIEDRPDSFTPWNSENSSTFSSSVAAADCIQAMLVHECAKNAEWVEVEPTESVVLNSSMHKTPLATVDSIEARYYFAHAEITVWKDDTVTITDPTEAKSPVMTFRRAPNPLCDRA